MSESDSREEREDSDSLLDEQDNSKSFVIKLDHSSHDSFGLSTKK